MHLLWSKSSTASITDFMGVAHDSMMICAILHKAGYSLHFEHSGDACVLCVAAGICVAA